MRASEIVESSKGLWANIHAKREGIKAGSGEKMRKPSSKGAPTKQDFKSASKESVEENLSPEQIKVGQLGPTEKIGPDGAVGKLVGTNESLMEETYHGNEFYEAYGVMWFNEDEQLDEAEYHGRKVPLGKPMQGDVKKFKVYVKDPKTGNIKKVNFGDPNMRIKKSNPARRKSFRARHNCANPGPRTKARYWSCRKW